ncbi:MAG: cysteine-rich CWC family protein [Sterolibacterium sp.]|nr:cysteine-rich CWC family protein [Sterolibacterium sp.]MBP9799558.1 cysteine-rich CWC family protein [Sterolibacterium sp.]
MSDSAAQLSGMTLCAFCAGCGRRFTCGVEAGQAHCWCFDLPAWPVAGHPEVAEGRDARCYCPECLAARRVVVSASSAPGSTSGAA